MRSAAACLFALVLLVSFGCGGDEQTKETSTSNSSDVAVTSDSPDTNEGQTNAGNDGDTETIDSDGEFATDDLVANGAENVSAAKVETTSAPANDDLVVDDADSSDDLSVEDPPTNDVESPVSQQDAIQKLQEEYVAAMKSSDLKAGREILIKVREIDSSNTNVTIGLANLSMSLAKKAEREEAGKLLAEAAQLWREVEKSIPERQRQAAIQQALLAEARSLAALKKPSEAVQKVRSLLETGFSQLMLLEDDKYLELLVKRPTVRKMIREVFRDQARNELAEAESFDFDFSLPNLDGQTVTKSDFSGKLLIVDIWGTWCGPCKLEIPHFVALRKKHAAELDIVGINYEHSEGAAAVAKIRRFVEDEGVTYTCVVGDEATKDQVPNFGGFPTTLFLDAEGNVRLKLVGYHPYEKLEAIVLELLDENA